VPYLTAHITLFQNLGNMVRFKQGTSD